MIHNKIEIKTPGMDATGYLYTYFLDSSIEMRPDEKRPVILMCPGGGYEMTSDREAEPVAMRFLAMGYHVAILRYSVSPVRYPAALLQVAGSVLYLKKHAEEYHIDPEKIVVQGCSAGGHLAADYGVSWHQKWIADAMATTSEQLKIAGLLLCYPVITSGEKAHEGSFRNLLGDACEEKKAELSLENQVTEQTPPTFLWHTYEDICVPVENTLMYAAGLRRVGVPFELHIFEKGEHGLSRVSDELIWSKRKFEREYPWLSLSVDWLNQLF